MECGGSGERGGRHVTSKTTDDRRNWGERFRVFLMAQAPEGKEVAYNDLVIFHSMKNLRMGEGRERWNKKISFNSNGWGTVPLRFF